MSIFQSAYNPVELLIKKWNIAIFLIYLDPWPWLETLSQSDVLLTLLVLVV
jgi:hypothetical protein